MCFSSRESRVADHRGRQITLYLPNKIFSAKSTRCRALKAYKELYDASMTHTHVHTHKTTTVPLAHAPRVNYVTQVVNKDPLVRFTTRGQRLWYCWVQYIRNTHFLEGVKSLPGSFCSQCSCTYLHLPHGCTLLS